MIIDLIQQAEVMVCAETLVPKIYPERLSSRQMAAPRDLSTYKKLVGAYSVVIGTPLLSRAHYVE